MHAGMEQSAGGGPLPRLCLTFMQCQSTHGGQWQTQHRQIRDEVAGHGFQRCGCSLDLCQTEAVCTQLFAATYCGRASCQLHRTSHQARDIHKAIQKKAWILRHQDSALRQQSAGHLFGICKFPDSTKLCHRHDPRYSCFPGHGSIILFLQAMLSPPVHLASCVKTCCQQLPVVHCYPAPETSHHLW